MSSRANAPAPERWIQLSDAVRTLGYSRPTVKKLAERGLIGVRQLPGLPPLYNATDVDRLAQASTRPARAS